MMTLLSVQSSRADPPYYHSFLRSLEILAIPKVPSEAACTTEDSEGGNAGGKNPPLLQFLQASSWYVSIYSLTAFKKQQKTIALRGPVGKQRGRTFICHAQ